MRKITPIVSAIALALVVVPSLFFWMGGLDLDTLKIAALVGTIAWFAATPFWMSREPSIDDAEVEI